jgi:hypothetical protein
MTMTERICAARGCDKPCYRSRHYCGPHQERKRVYGDPLHPYLDLTGSRYGLLTVTGKGEERPPRWVCMCDCGAVVKRTTAYLTRTKSRPSNCGNDAHVRATLTYEGVHSRLRLMGSARDHNCTACNRQAHEWAYNHQDGDERVSPQGWRYSVNQEYYEPMCVSCHRSFDKSWTSV